MTDRKIIYVYAEEKNKAYITHLSIETGESASEIINRLIEAHRDGTTYQPEPKIPKYVYMAEKWKRKKINLRARIKKKEEAQEEIEPQAEETDEHKPE